VDVGADETSMTATLLVTDTFNSLLYTSAVHLATAGAWNLVIIAADAVHVLLHLVHNAIWRKGKHVHLHMHMWHGAVHSMTQYSDNNAPTQQQLHYDNYTITSFYTTSEHNEWHNSDWHETKTQ